MELKAKACCNLCLQLIGNPARNIDVPLTNLLVFKLAAQRASANETGSTSEELVMLMMSVSLYKVGSWLDSLGSAMGHHKSNPSLIVEHMCLFNLVTAVQ